MNPDSPIDPRAALESSLTALLLGELPHEQAAALHQKLAQDAELAKLYERLRHTINLVRETVARPAAQAADQPAPLKLSDQRRQKLLQHFKTVAPKAFARPRRRTKRWLVEIGIAAALVALMASMLVPNFTKARSTSMKHSFGTWSLSQSIAPMPLAADKPQSVPMKIEQRLQFIHPGQGGTPQAAPGQAAKVEPLAVHAAESPPPPRAAGTAIVLPQSGELADATTTSPALNGGNSWTEPAPADSRAVNMAWGTLDGSDKPAVVLNAQATLTDVENAGNIFWGPNAPRSDSANKLADTTVSRDRKEAVSSFEVQNAAPQDVANNFQDLFNRDKVRPQSSGVNPMLGQASPLYQREKANTQPTRESRPGVVENASAEWNLGTGNANLPPVNPSSGFHGGILLGPREAAPSGGDRGVAQNRTVLRSPKESGLASGSGGAAAAPAPSSAQETKALGFEWYRGNSLATQSPASAFKGTPKDVPMLSDVPVVGGLFTGTHGVVGSSGKADTGTPAAPPASGKQGGGTVVFANSLRPTPPPAAGKQKGDAYFSLDPETHRLAYIANGSTAKQMAQSPIVLPPPPETSLALLDNDGRKNVDVGQGFAFSNASHNSQNSWVQNFTVGGDSFAAANEPIAFQANLEDTGKQGAEEAAKTQPYFEAKRQLEEAQRFRQVLEAKSASEKSDAEMPKTAMVEIVDKASAEPAQSPTLGDRIRGALSGKVERTARIRVARDQTDISGLAERGSMAGYDPYFIQTEFGAMQSEAVLGKVIKELNLNEAWGKKQGGRTLTTAETMALLKKNLDLRSEQNTSLIDVGVKSDQPEEAARIANAIAEAYAAHRVEQRAQLAKNDITTLEESRARLDQRIASAKADVERLGREVKESSSKQVAVATPEYVSEVVPIKHGKASDIASALNSLSSESGGTSVGGGTVDSTPKVALKPAASAPVPQPEVQTADNAFSTFSLNVSDVSFKLAAASLEKGVLPEPATVRSEEFINAFDYRDPEPPPGVPVAFAWERARYPFAQNRDLLRFSIKTAAQGRQPGRPLNLVLLLDNSGSMERADRVRIIHEALRVLASQLQAQDTFSVVTFARTAHLWVDGVSGSQAAKVAEEVSGLTPQGGTNLEDAMNLAYQTALRHYLANGINRVVLLTDGAANLGNVEPEALKQKVEAHRKQGVALDCFGIGWEGYNDDLLEVLSRNGDGRYAFLNTPEEAAGEFAAKLAGALQVAASDVKAQVEFNPGRVTAYRQIGYAKHQLTKEQFRDNTVNAAQIGAAEAGNALYVVEVNPNGASPLCTVRVRFRIPGTSDYREHAWEVPYNGSAEALEQASPAMRLAATASAFSEWLVSSPYAADVTPDRLLGYLSGVPEVCGADARPKKLEWMIRQAKSIAGK